ncbi:hypothetical protein ILYODFUR_027669, partial [Ilyodon furcidens]
YDKQYKLSNNGNTLQADGIAIKADASLHCRLQGAPLHHCPRTSGWGGALEPTSARKAGRGLRAISGEETVVVLVWGEKEKELHKNPTETGGTSGQPGAQAWMTFSHSVEKGTQWLSVCGWTTQRMTSTW